MRKNRAVVPMNRRLSMPDAVLTPVEREVVKASAKKLSDYLHEMLVQDWRRKVATIRDVNTTIWRVLDEDLPEGPYTLDVFSTKAQPVYDHVHTTYGDNGESDHDSGLVPQCQQGARGEVGAQFDVNRIADDVVTGVRVDPSFAAHVSRQLQSTDDSKN